MTLPEDVILQVTRSGKTEEVRATVRSWETGGQPRIDFMFKEPLTFNNGDTIGIVGYVYDAPKLIEEFARKRNETATRPTE